MNTIKAKIGIASSVESEFQNEPFIDFRKEENAQRMRNALQRVESQLGLEYAIVINGARLRTTSQINSVNPARPSQVVGIHQEGDSLLAGQAIQAALDAHLSWRNVPVKERVSLLLRSANIIRDRKFEFCAWLIYEVGKNWSEADADVAETIDFLEYYSSEALRLARAETPIQYPGERNELVYRPLGVGAVIPPWNFPLAIMAGMTAAAIVCGNTVVLKPSIYSPTIAAHFFRVLEEAGLPDGVVNFCPGSGDVVGRCLVAHAKTRFVAFTGSKKVGLEIHELAAQAKPGQLWMKRTILEMGGKGSIIVASDSNLDSAVDGVVSSAFGFSGQKCSACSRAIVDEKIYDAFLKKLVDKVKRFQSGDPVENAAVGPVIDRNAYDKILNYIEVGLTEGRLLTGGKALTAPESGYFIAPTVIADVPPNARIAQEEIFGPVLAVVPARGFEEAITIANNTEYGLTGAVYSSSRETLELARRDFHVGNLYFNRKCTDAMVGAHPFGGFNMSGTDSKAGGPDYLYLFTQAQSVAEKLAS